MVSALNDKSTAADADKISAYLWGMFVICFVGNILGGAASTLMSVYLPVLVKDLLGTVEEEKLGQVSAYISALYFVGWAIGGLFMGVICDRIGRSKSLALSIGIFGLFTLLVSFVFSWEMIIVLRFMCGFGVGGMLVINNTLLSEIWPQRTRAVFIGILSIGFPVGIFSSGAINYMVSSWREGFMMGILPLGLCLIAFFIIKESDAWMESRTVKGDRQVRQNIRDHRTELLNGSIIFGSILIGLWAVFSWVPTWVQSLLTGSDGQRERGISMMLLGAGGLSGGFVSGWLSNALGTRKAMLACFAGCFILSFLLFKGNSTFTGITVVEIALLAFMYGISQGLLAVYIPQLFAVSIRAMATGFCFNIGRFFTAAVVFFVGALVTTLGGYGNSLFAFSSVLVVGFVILLLTKKI
ncbi:MAG TPA: MFS transporter [Chryseolinea sp.]|nr:MFS transporter [Chryseolinea sp.]